MTRILYWNIENFSVNKFWDGNILAGGPFTPESTNRLTYFRSAVTNLLPPGAAANARMPEIIVIVELETGYTNRGYMVTGNGPLAARELVREVRNLTGNPNWFLVPPLYSGTREGVVVLYDGTNLFFTGPNFWSGAAGPSVSLAPPLPLPTYPVPWNPFIGTRQIPHLAQYNPNLWENQLAAKVSGYTSNGDAVLDLPDRGGIPPFGHVMDGNLDPRTPYMTTFYRQDTNENITIFSIHAPANAFFARAYMTSLVCTREIATPSALNERKVVLGDFNFNLFTNGGNAPRRYQYFNLIGYGIGVAPVLAPPVPQPNGYSGFFATHLAKVGNAISWSDIHTQRIYPGYGYLSERNSCIDNVFSQGVAPANTTILNPIVGSPYGVLPPGVAPPPWLTANMQGHYGMNRLCPCFNLPNPPPAWIAPNYGVNPAQIRQVFRGWANFRTVRSTSDHLPIIADV
jgi:hypothetical protein